MEILLKDTQQVITDIEFKLMYPNTSFPQVLNEEILNEYNAVVIMEGPQAVTSTLYEYSYRNGIQEINGKWFTKYEIGPVFVDNDEKTAEEQLTEYKYNIDATYADGVRNRRNELLKNSDWTQVVDATVDKNVWLIYRQQLRDITTQESFPFDIQWPEQPTQ